MRMNQIVRPVMLLKVWDVVAPRNDWEHNMAHMQYLLVGLRRTFSKTIEVDLGGCVFCGQGEHSVCDRCGEEADNEN